MGLIRGLARMLLATVATACLGRAQRIPPTPVSGANFAAPMPMPVSASAVAISQDGQRLAAVNPDSDSVSLVDIERMKVLAEVGVGDDPRTVAFSPDGTLVFAANYGSANVSVVDVGGGTLRANIPTGGRPYGIVVGLRRAYVSIAAPPEIIVIDPAALTVTTRIALEPFPTGLALSADEQRLLVTHLFTGRVSIVDTASLALASIGSAAEANLAQFVALSPDGRRAYVPVTESRSDNRALAYNTTVRPSVIVLDLDSGVEAPGARLSQADLDQPVNLPFAVAVSPDGQRLFVANAGSDDVSVIDLGPPPRAVAHWPVGRNPRGLALTPDGRLLFVNNVLAGTLDVFDTRSMAKLRTLLLTELPLDALVLEGKRLFNSSLPPMSQEHWLSCATCHLDGGADGRTWLGMPDGPRATPALFDAARTLPLHWNGGLDELQDVERTIRMVQYGQGLLHGGLAPAQGAPIAGRSSELDALAAYLSTLDGPPSPYQPVAAPEVEAVRRGQGTFDRWGCAVCHAPPLYTDLRRHASDAGGSAIAGALIERPMIDTPSLLGAWATAPYFHDGSVATLKATFYGAGFHRMGYAMDAGEADDLVAFLRALPLAGAGP